MAVNPLWERWKVGIEVVSKHFGSRSTNVPPVEEFKRQLRTACSHLIKEVSPEHNSKGLDEIARGLEGDILSRTGLKGIEQLYAIAYMDRQNLLNQQKQEDWADVREKLRFLIFRTALAFMIAGVVLLTAYLAKQWDIPLPMLRTLQ